MKKIPLNILRGIFSRCIFRIVSYQCKKDRVDKETELSWDALVVDVYNSIIKNRI